MSRDKFNEILEDVKLYFPAEAHAAGKPAIPVKFLLAGTLRWLAGGSPHDIVYFCGMRASKNYFCILKPYCVQGILLTFFISGRSL